MPPVNRIDQLIAKLRASKASAAEFERALAEVDRNMLREDEIHVWYEHWGRAAEDRGHVDLAIQRYEGGLARFPGQPSLAHLLRLARERNRVDVVLDQVVKAEGGYSAPAVETALRNMPRAALRPEEAIGWHQAYAAAAMRRNDRNEALARYQAAVAEFPTAGVLRFGLGQELEARGQADTAFAHFAHAPFPSVPAEYVLLMSHYAFLWGRPAEGARLLAPLMNHVLRFDNFDAHFLRARKLPAADRLVRFAIALAYQQGTEALEQLESRISRHLEAFERISCPEIVAELRAARTRDQGPLIAALQTKIATPRYNPQEGDRARLLAAQVASGVAAAGSALLKLVERYPAMFNAIAASLCHRAGDAAGELRYLRQLSSDGLLSIPSSDVVAYALLPYSERMRARHIELRREAAARRHA